MKKIALPHLQCLGIALCLAAFLLWLFSPKQIASFHDIADTYGEIIGGILGVGGAFSVALYTLHSERRHRRTRTAVGVSGALRRLHEEILEKLEQILVINFATKLKTPLPINFITLDKLILSPGTNYSSDLAISLNETFSEPHNIEILDKFIDDSEELSVDIHNSMITLRGYCFELKHTKFSQRNDIEGLQLYFFRHQMMNKIKTTIKIAIECEKTSDLIRKNYNQKIKKLNKLEDENLINYLPEEFES